MRFNKSYNFNILSLKHDIILLNWLSILLLIQFINIIKLYYKIIYKFDNKKLTIII